MNRVRLGAFAAVCVLAVAVGSASVVRGAAEADRAGAGSPTASPTGGPTVAAVRAAPHVAFVDTALGATFDHLAFVPLADPAGPRALTARTCERAYVTRAGGVCLSTDRGVLNRFRVTVLDAALAQVERLPALGVPSRARVSADGRLAASTVFVTGHSYADTGFSTATTVRDLRDDHDHGNLEDFRVILNGRTYRAPDVNVWGVTFAGADRFYATVGSRGETWLVRGDLAARTLTGLTRGVECPALSPDGTRVAYKRRPDPDRAEWRLHVLDLASGRDVALAETHNVDDQAEWLDDATVLYGLPRTGSATDVWAVPADGTGAPRVFIPDAWSPAVVR